MAGAAKILSPWKVSSRDFARLYWASSIVVDDYVYINGGEYYLAGAQSFDDLETVNGTLSIDISSSWDNTTVEINFFPKPTGLAQVKREALWWDRHSSSVISFGGAPYQRPNPPSIWSLTPDGRGAGSWSELYGPNDQLWESLVFPSIGLMAASEETGFFVGGVALNPNSDSAFAISGMIELEFATKQWTNATTVGLYSSAGWAVSGSAQFAPSFGKKGLVVMIGGSAPNMAWQTTNPSRSMSNITIFDPDEEKWYSQTASGDVPSERKDFCTVGVTNTSESSYEIFVHGGWSDNVYGGENKDSRDIYILTIPAFKWVRVTDSAIPSRAGSTCQLVGNRQFLSIGGWDPTSSAPYSPSDPWTYGLGVFDMTELTWTSRYDADAAPYVRSEAVNKYYANSQGRPSSWDSPGLEGLFASISTSNSTEPSEPRDRPSSSNSTPAIVGGVIGGVVFIIAAAGLLWWWFILRKRNPKDPASHSNTPAPPPSSGPEHTSLMEMEARHLSEVEENSCSEIGGSGKGANVQGRKRSSNGYLIPQEMP